LIPLFWERLSQPLVGKINFLLLEVFPPFPFFSSIRCGHGKLLTPGLLFTSSWCLLCCHFCHPHDVAMGLLNFASSNEIFAYQIAFTFTVEGHRNLWWPLGFLRLFGVSNLPLYTPYPHQIINIIIAKSKHHHTKRCQYLQFPLAAIHKKVSQHFKGWFCTLTHVSKPNVAATTMFRNNGAIVTTEENLSTNVLLSIKHYNFNNISISLQC